MANTPAILIEGLSKTYGRGKRPALSNLNLAIQQGEIFGYLGPNGAGKTTTIRILLDLIRPSSGHAKLMGKDVQSDSVELHRRIGFLPGELNLWENQTGDAIINYFGNLRGGVDKSYLKRLLDRLEFDPTKKMRTYSQGNKRKIGLVLALMHKPEMLILDEPTNGLDPLMQKTFAELMREEKARGVTIFLSSHMLTEVQSICERVGILREGQLRAVENVHDLLGVNFKWITFKFREAVSESLLDGAPNVSEVTVDNHSLKFRLTGDIDPVLRAVNHLYIADIHTQEPTLEEIFLTYYEGENKRRTGERPALEMAGAR